MTIAAPVPSTGAESLAADPSEMQDRNLPEYVWSETETGWCRPEWLIPIYTGDAFLDKAVNWCVPSPPTIQEIICRYDWPCQQALAVANCESTMNPAAFDGYNSGLFQVARKWHERRLRPDESLFDPGVNVRVAHEIWSEQGSGPWPYCGRYFN